MRIQVDGDKLTLGDPENARVIDIGTPEAFELLTRLWLRSGWDLKYVYSFTWMGRPIIQLPDDLLRIQEVIYSIKPDLVIETGVAHGGSLVFYASILEAMGNGRVIGVDVSIRPHNRAAIEAHRMAPRIALVEGSSTAASSLRQIRSAVTPNDRVLVVLDSNHTHEHVLEELRVYSEFVSVGSYIVACDGIMKDLVGAPRTQPDWATNNPQSAVEDFLAERSDFVLEEPQFMFNEGQITQRVTYWPNAFLKRTR